jgi:HNH endonuclease
MARPPSQYGGGIYIARFGSWRNALQEFVTFVKSDEWVASEKDADTEPVLETKNADSRKRRTGRNISERMRFRILLRDGFACQACGASPLQDRGVELHVDHIVPWSKDGETEESNLQTKCKRCNLGKGNAFNQ